MKPQPQHRKVKEVKFANKQSLKAFKDLPDDPRHAFSTQLESVVAHGYHPTIGSDTLPGQTIELKVNGRPAYRCVYKVLDDVIVVLHSFTKTAQGRDKKNLKTVETRLTTLDPAQFC